MRAKERLLVVEQDGVLQRLLRRALSHYELEATAEADPGALLACRPRPDLLLLSLSQSPWPEVLALCADLRLEIQTPIIVLAASPAARYAAEALDSGADDCVSSPFDPHELCARVRARLRRPRLAVENADGPVLLCSSDNYLALHVEQHQVFANSREVRLSRTEFSLLHLLMAHPGRILTHRWLLQEIWGPEYGEEKDYLRVYVRQLRCKIEPEPARPLYIQTERDLGYVFRAG